MLFSIIIPVFNRPDEVKELLESLSQTDYKQEFEIVIVEDGSTLPCENIVDDYNTKLNISYYLKYNSGPGDSRNFGMNLAKGDYFLIFDSDCIIPKQYLVEVSNALEQNYSDCFGGPDRALDSFTDIQKAINFAMTSVLTTGGIRGGSEKIDKFQPRSFNMGLSRKAFEATGGFGNMHPGEDPELTMRLWDLGFQTRLFPNAYVFHKRRIDWDKFSAQVTKFGKARPILNSKYPQYNKVTYFFPSLFLMGFVIALVLLVFAQDWLLKLYFGYFLVLFLTSSYQNKSIMVGFLSIKAVWKQFVGYGLGFIESFVKVILLKQNPQKSFPDLFFKI
ncbi:glycosyltransferase family 2 protein [Flavobacterium sp. GT3R68]|uniref:glycosyltransferase n=1 Tax=Flavobacterium sp. GT3R68 TaxID=2594437 RepID=UPI000F889020|nr:glycosyltransferase [Flavobacterium sp. GT3R68]RTY95083.1 glycosyltransferase [Flavobacterium sp. GSN2]TRW91889.1 glycosyltransferase [Flavobacterium sp. GT3R68]